MMSRSFTKREKILLLVMAVLLLGLVYYQFVIREAADAVERYDVKELESELLIEQAKGGFGLVYTDDYSFERYDSINQPFKLACYLASGIPVIVRNGCVHEAYVINNEIGFSVNTLEEADQIVSELSDAEYERLYENIKPIQDLITNGAYTRKLLSDALVRVLDKLYDSNV